jgi:nucleoside-diphosphate-sugar epimerase
MKKVLVLGGTGYLGSEVARLLSKKSIVTCLSRNGVRKERLIEGVNYV